MHLPLFLDDYGVDRACQHVDAPDSYMYTNVLRRGCTRYFLEPVA